MKTLSKEAEQQILDAISDICEEVDNGMTPTKAAIKVAKARDFNRNFVKLAISGYNTGATTYQREQGKSILEKLASFPIVMEEEVMSALFPSKVLTPIHEKNASAISSDYSRAPKAVLRTASLEKAASVALEYPDAKPLEKLAGDPKIAMSKAVGQADRLKIELAEARLKYAEAQELFVRELGCFSDYFKQSRYNRDWAFEDVDAIAAQTYGPSGTSVMDYAYNRNRSKEARATNVKSAQAVDWSQEPFSKLAKCIELGKQVVALRSEFNTKQAETETRVNEILHPFCHTQPQSSNVRTGGTTETKEASLWGGFTYNLSKPISDGLIKTVSGQQSKAEDAFSDPYIDQEMQAIRARAMLQDLLSNDEVISGYEPDQVIDGYNELASLSPNAATQVAMMRPMLRKWLTQGSMEPFEVQELTNVEKTLQQNKPTSKALGPVKDVQRTTSILG